MLYHIIYPLETFFSPFNIFRYVTFRSMVAAMMAFTLSFILFPIFIKSIKKRNFTQTIRGDGPPTHLSKDGTPTMGGIVILFICLSSTLLCARLDNRFIIISIICLLWLGFFGWLDDYLKIIKKHPKGLKAKWKLIPQVMFGFAVSIYLYFFPSNKEFSTKILLPYLKETYIDLWLLYPLFSTIVFVGASNAVNLTDGLDGLAIGCVIICAATYSIFAYLADIPRVASYLKIIHTKDTGELCILLSSLIGSGLGFLWFNSYPASIFLGDSGALFLGGIIGLIALFVKQEIILVMVGGIFIAEVLSVVLQVFSYKRYRKRIFKMAPLHHHFELKGLPEPKITIRFWLVNVILALIALSSLKIK